MKSTIVILNPAARSERARRWREKMESLTGGAVICATSRCGEAEVIARRAAAEGFTTIVAAGGDGTINEVVNGMAGTNAALGLLPMGTMNVFAMELGIPASNLGLCWEIIQQQKTRLIDMPLREFQTFRPARRRRSRCASGEGNEPRLQAQFRTAELSCFGRANRRAASRLCSRSSRPMLLPRPVPLSSSAMAGFTADLSHSSKMR